jgi:tetratricopeptide (TPR) repeat protein
MIRRAAKFEPKLLLNSIAYYRQKGMLGQAAAAADLLVNNVKDKFDGEDADDYLLLAAQAYANTDRIDEGLTLLQNGLKQRPQSPKLRRALSDACRIKFRSTITKTETQIQVNLDLLNLAIIFDPTNIAIQEDLAFLSTLGIGHSEETLESLRLQIALNWTSFASRMIIAESSVRRGDLASAINQYEVVLAELPNMTVVLNNLAMAYTMVKPARLEDALKLIDRGLEIAPNIAEFHDTRGTILKMMDRTVEAVESYLKALEKFPEAIKTRETLIALYDEIGSANEAQKQRELLAQIKTKIQEQREKTQNADQQALPKQSLGAGALDGGDPNILPSSNLSPDPVAEPDLK